jgi:hypothetical protein
MINRLTHTSAAAAVALQEAAELRRNQAANAQPSQPKAGTQYNFAEIFGGANWGETEETAQPATAVSSSSPGAFQTAIASATAKVITDTSTDTGAQSATAATAAASTATTTTAAATTTPGVETLVTAIMNGSFQPTYVTNPSQLQEITPVGTDYMPNFYYASDQTANQMAQLLGGTVVQKPAFGQDEGWTEPLANFIQLPNGQTFNAADVAYYARGGSEGAAQLTADITSTINQGSAWAKYYQDGGQMPSFAEGYVGPPISGMTYSASMIGSDGNVINPAMQSSAVSET